VYNQTKIILLTIKSLDKKGRIRRTITRKKFKDEMEEINIPTGQQHNDQSLVSELEIEQPPVALYHTFYYDTMDPPDDITVKCSGTITQYCPGIGEYFVVFDEPFIFPRWITIKDTESIAKLDMEIFFDIPEDNNNNAIMIKHEGSTHKRRKAIRDDDDDVYSESTVDNTICCGLCNQQKLTDTEVGELLTCSKCKYRSFHKYCMSMSRVGLSEGDSDANWCCWHCICE
jgi:hypothetical protein